MKTLTKPNWPPALLLFITFSFAPLIAAAHDIKEAHSHCNVHHFKNNHCALKVLLNGKKSTQTQLKWMELKKS